MNEYAFWFFFILETRITCRLVFTRIYSFFGNTSFDVLIRLFLTSFYILIVFLATCKQSYFRKNFYKKPGPKYKHPSWGRAPILKRCPQAKGIVTRVTTMTPKKPNSAIRHVAKVNLMNGLRVTARMPGKGYLCSKYNRVLVEGGRANDLPGVGYTAIRGAFDFSPVVGKIRRRSIYGVSRPNGYTKFVRRSLRRI